MLKVLLYLGLSLFALNSFSQTLPQDLPRLAETVLEDPNNTISGFNSSITESLKVVLSWKISGELPDFFAIERSENGTVYEMVAILNNLGSQLQYQWTDEAPKKGRSFYRLRYAVKKGPALYSKAVSQAVERAVSFKFYPNPVDHILIVRSETPIEVQISDANGKVRITENRVKGLYTINVSSLEKGVYLIRFSSKLTNVISQEKLIKN